VRGTQALPDGISRPRFQQLEPAPGVSGGGLGSEAVVIRLAAEAKGAG